MAGIFLSIEVDDKGSIVVKQFADKTKEAFDEMKKGPEAAKGPLASLREGWIGLTAKVTLATGVIYGVSRAITSFVEEAAEAESIEKRLQFALETTGYSWTTAKSAVDQFAKSVMESTRFSDEQARQALTDLMMYTNEYSKAEQGARLAMDMSTRTGQDLSSATRLIGMAMTGNVEMLGRYLPQLRNLDAVLGADASMAEKAAYALKVLEERFAGTAQADLDTYSGKLKQFQNAWAELKEEWGSKLLPVLTTVFERLTGIARVMSTPPKGGLYEQVAEWEGLGPFVNAPTPYPTESERRFTGWGMAGGKKDVFAEDYSQILKKSGDESAKAWGDYAQAELDALEKMQLDAVEQNKKYWDMVEKAREDDIAAVVAYADEELANKEKLQLELVSLNKEYWDNRQQMEQNIIQGEQEAANIVAEAWDVVGKVQIEQLNEQVKASDDVVRMIGSDFSSAWSTNLTQMIKGAESFSDAVKNIFAGMGDAIINTISKMAANWLMFGSLTGEKGGTSFFGKSLGGYGGIIGGIASLFKAQEGGVFTQPSIVMAGEVPEAFVPLKGGKIPVEMGNGGGGMNVTVINYNQVNDPNTFVRLYGPVVKKLSAQSVEEAKRFTKAGAT